jgi:hypothetical protein
MWTRARSGGWPTADITKSIAAVGSAMLVGLLSFDYTINHFYKIGAPFWDSGHFAYYVAFSTEWPMSFHPAFAGDINAPGGSFFAIHFQPIFYLTTALHHLLSFVPPAAYFSALQGAWLGLLAASCFIFLSNRLGTTPASLVLTSLIAIVTALNGTILSTTGFPHIEIAIPALFFAFLGARGVGKNKIAFILLLMALSIREDAGLHIGAILALLALAQWVSGAGQVLVRANAATASICFVYSIVCFVGLRLFYQGDMSFLSHMYIGSPPFHHLNFDLIRTRIHVFLTDKAYAVWPVLFLLVAAALRRDILLLVAPVAVLPWLMVSLTAVSDMAGTLVSHYAFPTIFPIVWPSACYFLNGDSSPSGWWKAVGMQTITSLSSIVLFVLLGAGNHDNAPWGELHFPPVSAIGRYEAKLRMVIGKRDQLGRLIVDDAVLSLVPETVGKHEWVLKWTSDHDAMPAGSVPCPDSVIYQPGAYGSVNTLRVIRTCGLSRSYRLSDTPYMLSSRNVVDIDGFVERTSP